MVRLYSIIFIEQGLFLNVNIIDRAAQWCGCTGVALFYYLLRLEMVLLRSLHPINIAK
jgi:hypothetical protein